MLVLLASVSTGCRVPAQLQIVVVGAAAADADPLVLVWLQDAVNQPDRLLGLSVAVERATFEGVFGAEATPLLCSDPGGGSSAAAYA